MPFTTLYPSAALPRWSIAIEPIQRWMPSPGLTVPCWWIEYAPFTRRISYQRTPATPGLASTDWLVTIVSYVANFR